MSPHTNDGPIHVDDLVAIVRNTTGITEQVDADTPLLSSGMIDSFDVVGLLSAIETRFGVAIDPQHIDGERFDTPAQMRDVVEELR